MTPKAERNRSRLSRRLELAHHLLAESGRLMRILSAIVEPLLMVVLDTRHDLLLGRLVAPELISDNHSRYIPQTFQQRDV